VSRSSGSPPVGSSVDQRHVAERLWKVSDQPAGCGVVLLRQQSDVVAQREQPLEDLPGLVVPTHQGVVVGEPERAGEERALAGGQPVDAVARLLGVALHEAVLQQLPLDGGDGALHAFVGGWEEADQRDHQQRGVELPGAACLARTDRSASDTTLIALRRITSVTCP
jgi:hypothetical protein